MAAAGVKGITVKRFIVVPLINVFLVMSAADPDVVFDVGLSSSSLSVDHGHQVARRLASPRKESLDLPRRLTSPGVTASFLYTTNKCVTPTGRNYKAPSLTRDCCIMANSGAHCRIQVKSRCWRLATDNVIT